MSEAKFRADLRLNDGQHIGHIIISETIFKWKPIFGHNNEFKCPIEEVVGYAKLGSLIWKTLFLKFAKEDEIKFFWGGWKADFIIRELKRRNPSIEEFNMKRVYHWYDWILYIVYFLMVITFILMIYIGFNGPISL